MTLTYAERERRRNPLLYEKTRLVIDTATALKLALEDRGMTQRELARELDVDPSIVSRQLNGAENLTLGKLAELAYYLGARLNLTLVPLPRTAAASRASNVCRLNWPARRNAVGHYHLAETPLAETPKDVAIQDQTAA